MADLDSMQTPFRCKTAAFHFIYSFMLAGKDKEPVHPPDLFRDPNVLATVGSLPHLVPGRSPLGLPPSRSGIAPHLSLAPDSASLEFVARPGRFAGMPLALSSLIRLFSAGGTCTLKVEAAPAAAARFTTRDLLNFLKLTKTKSSSDDPDYLVVDGREATSLYNVFTAAVTETSQALGLAWPEMDPQEGLLNVDSADGQNPWVVTVAEVEGDVANAFCRPGEHGVDPAEAKMLKIRRYEPEIAQIVFRSVAQSLSLEPAYLQPPTPGGVPGLFSVNVDARLFVCMSRRSILCICENAAQDPASYFLPGLLDVCETVRARWHALIMLNKMMDLAMHDFAHLRGRTLDRRKTLQSVRMLLASSLEDPTMYIVAGDALSKILDDLARIFRLDELRSALLGKMDLIDRIYSDARELKWLEKGISDEA